MNLLDSPYLDNVSQQRRTWQMALYASHLATGHNLFCKALKASTIISYLRDVARFLGRFSAVDPRHRSKLDRSTAPEIKAVTDEVARWEKVPNRREPFTIQMWKYLFSIRDSCPPDGIIDCITDWAACGLYGGFRKTEWAQDVAHASLDNPQLDIHGVPKAFRLADIVWKTPTQVNLSLHDVLSCEDSTGRVSLIFKAKKMVTTELPAFLLAIPTFQLCVLFVTFFESSSDLSDFSVLNPTSPSASVRMPSASFTTSPTTISTMFFVVPPLQSTN